MTTKDLKERTDAEKAAAAPISLPSGSFTLADIEKLAEDAAGAKPEQRDEVISKGLAAANQTPVAEQEPGLEAGFKYVDVEREDLGVTERVQVREKPAEDPEKDKAVKANSQPSDPATTTDKGKPGSDAAANKE